MFDDVSVLDGDATADALAASRLAVLLAEAEQLALAAHWADLHAPEFVAACHAVLPGGPALVDRVVTVAGVERVVASGAPGCPEMAEFAAAELAALLGRSTRGGQQLIADAVNLRHRHPLLWRRVLAGEVRVWVAVKVARRCAAADLVRDAARWVDEQTTGHAASLPVGRFLDLVEARIVEADPEAAAARAESAALAQFVRAGQSDEHGLRTLVARAQAGDITYLVAVVDRIAQVLAEQGDTAPVEVRRAAALRVLANPARALALLTESALEHADGEAEPEAGVLSRLAEALDGFDESRLDPACTLFVHVTDTGLAEALRGAGGRGIARWEGAGPLSVEALRGWLGPGCRVTVRPVLDAGGPIAVDRYEIPAAMAEAVRGGVPYDCFPYGTLPSRLADLDHVEPYRRDGTAAQTRPGNLAPLSRAHHRIKTHGRWRVLTRAEDPRTWWWRTPHGHWLRVDGAGTHPHGRDTRLDRELLGRRRE